jgi:hypothetical protein
MTRPSFAVLRHDGYLDAPGHDFVRHEKRPPPGLYQMRLAAHRVERAINADSRR